MERLVDRHFFLGLEKQACFGAYLQEYGFASCEGCSWKIDFDAENQCTLTLHSHTTHLLLPSTQILGSYSDLSGTWLPAHLNPTVRAPAAALAAALSEAHPDVPELHQRTQMPRTKGAGAGANTSVADTTVRLCELATLVVGMRAELAGYYQTNNPHMLLLISSSAMQWAAADFVFRQSFTRMITVLEARLAQGLGNHPPLRRSALEAYIEHYNKDDARNYDASFVLEGGVGFIVVVLRTDAARVPQRIASVHFRDTECTRICGVAASRSRVQSLSGSISSSTTHTANSSSSGTHLTSSGSGGLSHR
eukprot:gnl/Spiro4/13300_TR7069_c0_g1_i1.p1 gnl/Spiro4/13300_TR7069_c0_g1~~gnl/Spiro4/13300_TR7069_c0_g1_i1.p1  ORF type:complete len:307 (+),score=92.54 gnl/Spiro4/13300_TR7069_c0_g1_i1:65-985(+)